MRSEVQLTSIRKIHNSNLKNYKITHVSTQVSPIIDNFQIISVSPILIFIIFEVVMITHSVPYEKARSVIKMERERKIAIEILDEFEELLAEKDIKIPSNDREPDGQNQAFLYGTEYYDLEDKITDILKREFRKPG